MQKINRGEASAQTEPTSMKTIDEATDRDDPAMGGDIDDIGVLFPNFGDIDHGGEIATQADLDACTDVSDLI